MSMLNYAVLKLLYQMHRPTILSPAYTDLIASWGGGGTVV